jgi:hypothetical protein
MSTNDNLVLQQSQSEEGVNSDSDDDDVDEDPNEDPNEEPNKKKEIKGHPPKCRWCRPRPCIMADGGFYACLLEYFQDYVEPEYEAKSMRQRTSLIRK